MTIPRGQALLAAGKGKPGDKKFSVSARRGDTAYGICSNEFLEQAFRTDSYKCDITFNDDGTWTYFIETELMVKGTNKPFLHHDTNTMRLVEPPQLNPWAQKLKDQGKNYS